MNGLAGLGAVVEIVVNRVSKRSTKSMRGVSVEPDHIRDARMSQLPSLSDGVLQQSIWKQ